MFKKWCLLTNPSSGSMPLNSFMWYHIFTCGINHTRRWFHKWSSTLSDHQMKNASLNYKSSSVSNGWPMLSHRGRCPRNWSQDQKSYVWYLKKPYTRYKWYKLQVVSTNGVISNNQVMSIKNARFKPQPSTPNAYPCINEKLTFYGNWWQREEIVQRYEKPL